MSLVVYAFVRTRAGAVASLVAMLVATLASREPQAHFECGGNATVLSLALATYGLLLLERLEAPAWYRVVVPSALVIGAAVLAHTVIPYALLFVLPPIALLRVSASADRAWRRLPLHWMTVALASAVVVLPYLARFDVSVGPSELPWIRRWQQLPAHVPAGPVWAYPATVSWYIGRRLGAIYALWILAALVARRWIRAGSIREELLFAGLALLLVANAAVWILPASYALYPDRVMILLVPIGAGILGVAVGAWSRGRSARARLSGALAVCASVAVGAAFWFVPAIASVAVTDDDLEATRWIEAGTPRDAVILNNYGDAGVWIPAIAFRAVCNPHVNVIYMEELESWRRDARRPADRPGRPAAAPRRTRRARERADRPRSRVGAPIRATSCGAPAQASSRP